MPLTNEQAQELAVHTAALLTLKAELAEAEGPKGQYLRARELRREIGEKEAAIAALVAK